jgi:Holliday junction resolvase RusA-like endonuclease
MISFTVHGIAQPAGSKRAFALRRRDGSMITRPDGSPVVNVVDDNKKSKSWKQEVASAAAKVMEGRALLHGPLLLAVVFVMPRPKSHFRTGKNEGQLRPDAPRFHTKKPDVTKLVRGLEDALTGVVWNDDAQVADTRQRKEYGPAARVEVNVVPLVEANEREHATASEQQVLDGLFS